MTYYPVLKLSNAEMGAMEHLKEDTKEHITPIIESKHIPEEKTNDWTSSFKTLGTYLSRKLGQLEFIYDFDAAFSKIGEVTELKDEDLNENLVEYCINKMEHEQLRFIPCIHFDAPQWMIDSVLHSNPDKLAIRVRCHDFNSSLEDMITERINDKIIRFATDKKIIILLDFFNAPINKRRIITSIENFSQLNFNELVLIQTSCPENANKAPANSLTPIEHRDDIKTYFQLKKPYPHLMFGDYTTRLAPALDISYVDFYNTYLKIFYSSEDIYYIGKSTLIKDNGIETFSDICQEIVDSDLFRGPEFSHGDQAIFDCANKTISISSHSKLIEYGINHHLELTVEQLQIRSPIHTIS